MLPSRVVGTSSATVPSTGSRTSTAPGPASASMARILAPKTATSRSDVITIEFKINFLRPGRGPRLTARGQALRAGNRVVVAESEVYAGEGEERELWWDRATAAFPQYIEYTKKTDRLIPVFVLTPA